MSRSRRRILMVTWKGPGHPLAGGAESLTSSLLEYLAATGHQVTWMTSAGYPMPVPPKSVRMLRRGTRLTVPIHAWRHLRRHEACYDLVIDQINTYPMLTAWSVPPERSVALIFQLARDIWPYEVSRPIAAVGVRLEPLLLRRYQKRRAITISASTARDLIDMGFQDVRDVGVALDRVPGATARHPPAVAHFVGLGRLVRMKRFEDQIEALAIVRESFPDASLTIIGRGTGSYVDGLRALSNRTPGVTLLEDVDEETKEDILASATAVLGTSVREGWGLMVSEGHVRGTPSIVYAVPGLVDSTAQGVSGFLVPPQPRSLATAMCSLAGDPNLWLELSAGARHNAEQLTVEALGARFVAALPESA